MDIKVIMICNILSQAHFIGKVLIERPWLTADGGRSRVGPELPFPRWDGWRLGNLEVLEHVLSTLLLFISERVQSCEGAVLYLWRGLFYRWPGRGARRTLLLAHHRELACVERVGHCRLTPTWSSELARWWRLAPGVGRDAKLGWHRLAPGRGWYG